MSSIKSIAANILLDLCVRIKLHVQLRRQCGTFGIFPSAIKNDSVVREGILPAEMSQYFLTIERSQYAYSSQLSREF